MKAVFRILDNEEQVVGTATIDISVPYLLSVAFDVLDGGRQPYGPSWPQMIKEALEIDHILECNVEEYESFVWSEEEQELLNNYKVVHNGIPDWLKDITQAEEELTEAEIKEVDRVITLLNAYGGPGYE